MAEKALAAVIQERLPVQGVDVSTRSVAPPGTWSRPWAWGAASSKSQVLPAGCAEIDEVLPASGACDSGCSRKAAADSHDSSRGSAGRAGEAPSSSAAIEGRWPYLWLDATVASRCAAPGASSRWRQPSQSAVNTEGRRDMVAAAIRTAFIQEDHAAASAQWRQVADTLFAPASRPSPGSWTRPSPTCSPS